MNNFEEIKNIEYFKTLSEVQIAEVAGFLKEENYEAEENLFIEGERSKGIYFVKSGTIKIYKSSKDGKEQILKLCYAGESFNDVTVFSANINPASADAVNKSTVFLLSKENLENLIFKYPEISFNIIRSLTDKLRFLTSRIEDLSLKHTQERIGKILLLFEGQKLSQKMIADIAGTAREVVSRALREFSNQDIIRLNKREIEIIDKGKLKKLVDK
jgi:CRP/FNR family transcriptional regulator